MRQCWVEAVIVVMGAPLLLVVAYLTLLTALSRRLPHPIGGAPRLRFAVVVPAHDEEAGIARTLASLRALDWPAHLLRVVVVADNCTDETGTRAAAAGAEVLVRTDAAHRGKGHALAFAFDRLRKAGTADAIVVVDADSLASANLLRAFAARIEGGAEAAQADYGVMNPDASWRTRLMTIAFTLFHRVRSRGRERLGLSAGLRGNGMCFSAGILGAVPHDAFSRVEDVEYGLRLAEAGCRVHYVGDAAVLGEMVSTESPSRSQRRRWEDGRRELRRREGGRLLRLALARRDPVLLDVAIDLFVPPLSAVAGGVALGLLASRAAAVVCDGSPLATSCYAVALALLVSHVLRGWWLSGTGWRGLAAMGLAPVYMAWKVLLRLRSPGERAKAWVRTSREEEVRHG
jgi:GT2 family glycosyltransferase